MRCIIAMVMLGGTLPSEALDITDEASLTAAVDQEKSLREAAFGELKRLAPEWFGRQEDAEFLRFLQNAEVATGLLCSGKYPESMSQSLDALHAIWKADASSLQHAELSTALAVALVFGDAKWPSQHAYDRYTYYRDSRRKGLLHPMFDTLNVWEKRYVVRGGGNGSYQINGGWDNASLIWLRDNVKLPAKDYTGACWQAPYRLNNVYGDSIHGSKYYMPFEHLNHAQRVREIGGVCGSLSHYGANAAMANGIPALTMGEPGHCAYAVRANAETWTPAYSLSWERGLHHSLWSQHTWTSLILQNKVLAARYDHEKSQAFLWHARGLTDLQPELAESAYRMALESQPLNLPAWIEAAQFRAKRVTHATSWGVMQKAALAALSDYPESAWEAVKIIQKNAMPQLSTDQRLPFLMAYHEAIAAKDGPVMWHFDKALAEQASWLTDEKERLAFFEAVLTVQSASKSWFAPTIAWGQSAFTKNTESSDAYYAALGRAFSAAAGGKNVDGLRAALRPAILAAASSQNVSAFQTLGQAGKAFLPQKAPRYEPFPGDLLSSGGLLKPSSTSNWDTPEQHWGVLESTGGSFHTNREVRAGCIVRLGKLGDLSGIVIVNQGGGQNGPRQVPLSVSVSEDGQQWTEVFISRENAPLWRIPLQGKATRVQFIKVARSDDRNEFFHLAAIHAYGKRLQ
ncbi:MAG: hypothetical protein RI957_524 [Verrucomicrobiota bacterium]